MADQHDHFLEWGRSRAVLVELLGDVPSRRDHAVACYIAAVDQGWNPPPEQGRIIRRAIKRLASVDDPASRNPGLLGAVTALAALVGLLVGSFGSAVWAGIDEVGPWIYLGTIVVVFAALGYGVIKQLMRRWEAATLAKADQRLIENLPDYTPLSPEGVAAFQRQEERHIHVEPATRWAAALTAIPLFVVGVFAVSMVLLGQPLLLLGWVPAVLIWAKGMQTLDTALLRRRLAAEHRRSAPDIEQIP